MARTKTVGDGIKREAYTTNLDPELIKKLKMYCVVKDKYQYEVIEKLLTELFEKEGGS